MEKVRGKARRNDEKKRREETVRGKKEGKSEGKW